MSKQSGLTIAISSPVISAIQTAQQMSQAAKDTKDGRMQALAAASTGLAAYNAAQAVKSGQGETIDGKANQMPVTDDAGKVVGSRDATAAEQLGGVNLVLSLGASKSSSQTTQTSDSAAVSKLTAGRDITITARGAGEASDITLQGVQAKATRNLTLTAEDEIKLLAARNTAHQKSSNQNASGSIGISLGTNTGVTVGASVGRGKADGDDLSHTNTRLQAGDTLTLQSGGDTTLRGAVAKAEQVVATVGGDLNIESLQDTSTFDSKQKSLGGSITFGVGVSGSVSASSSKINSDYASVVEQSGIRAGDGGFQVNVQSDTDLKGAAITSTQKAIDDGKNRFQTGGELTLSNIENKAEYEGQSFGINLGAGQNATGKFMPQGTSAGFGKDGDSASSTTLAAISGIAGNKDARTGDPESGIGKIFDQEKVQKEIDAQVRITQVFGQLAPKAAADYAGKQAEEFRKQGDFEEARKWEEGGVYRIALHTALGGLAGGTSGALGAGASAAAAPLLNELQSSIVEQLKSAGASDTVAKLTGQLISGATAAGIGAAVGGAQGATTAFNTDANNRQLHPEEKDLAKELAKKSKGKFTEQEIADALRWASNAELNETASSNIVVQLTPDTQAGEIFDAQSMSLDTSGGQAVLYQDLSRITPPGGELMAFIQQNTGDTYSWNTAAWQAVPQATFSQNGTRYGVFSANGQTFKLPLADCPAAGCTTSPIAWASTSPQDQAALQAYATAAGVEMTSFVSRTAGIVGSAATTAAATPGPHQPVAYATSVLATGIGLAADAVESYITQDPMKQLENAFYMYAIQRPVDITLPLAAPITNEVVEAWKASGTRKDVGEWVNQYWQEFRTTWEQK